MDPVRYVATKVHQPDDPDPISMRVGEIVTVGREYDGDPDWENWVRCENDGGKSGWVPKQVLRITGERGTAQRDYDARELALEPGDRLTGMEMINGWIWCRTDDGRTGWAPLKNLAEERPPSGG